ncbi:MAG: glycosyltransferase family A protein [Pseudomonadota bacterium]
MSVTISVVVAAYNVQRYIEACVGSILEQLSDQHELIVIDDGSHDNTLALVSRLQEQWRGKNFHVYSQANQGISATRNHCVRAAMGEYVAFIDSDDVLLPGALAALSEAIALHQPDVIACNFRMWAPESRARHQLIELGYPVGVPVTDRDDILNIFFSDRHMYVWANIFRRAIYARLPAPLFPVGRVFEDVATVPRLLSECASLLHLARPIIDYRQHPTSITRVVSASWCRDFVAALPLARAHLLAKGVSESVKRHFDLAAAYFYIAVVKNSYQLPLKQGRQVRADIKRQFVENLFGNVDTLMESVRSRALRSTSHQRDLDTIKTVQRALSNSLAFRFRLAASRKIKLWRRLRKTPK